MENETKFNLSQAAELAGTTRQRIGRLIKQGKLSAEKTADGKTVIDKSELLRFFENLVTPKASQPPQPDTSQITELLQSKIDLLQRELDITREKWEEDRREKGRLLAIIENQTRMLAAPKEPEPKKTFWQRLLSS
jgi:Helix-turn-helix domain